MTRAPAGGQPVDLNARRRHGQQQRDTRPRRAGKHIVSSAESPRNLRITLRFALRVAH
jgi:hypothetical protein